MENTSYATRIDGATCKTLGKKAFFSWLVLLLAFNQPSNQSIIFVCFQRHGVHVRPGYGHLYNNFSGRQISHFEDLESALKFVNARPDSEKIIFLHSGRHFAEPIVINTAIQIIGACAGNDLNIMQNVWIENQKDTTISFVDGSLGAYLGYCNVVFNPDKACPIQHTNHYALQIMDETDVVIDHCAIHSSSLGK